MCFCCTSSCVLFTVNFPEQTVAWLTWGPSHLSTNCLVLPGRISQYQNRPDTVPVCRWDIQRDKAGLSSRGMEADRGEHCVITVWEPWQPADALFPPVSDTATLLNPRLTTFSLSAPPVQLSYTVRKGKKRGKKSQATQVTLHAFWSPDKQIWGSPSIHIGDHNSHRHERVHKVLCWHIPLSWLRTQPLMTENGGTLEP